MQNHLFGALARDVSAVTGETTATHIANLSVRYLTWALEHPARYRFMFENTESGALLSQNDRQLALMSMRGLEAVIRLGVQRGEIVAEDPAATALILVSVLHGLCSLALAQRLETTAGEDVVSFLEAHQTGWINAILNT